MCEKYHIPIYNGAGWTSVTKLGKFARLMSRAEGMGLIPRILYFGDWDPVGDQISKNLVANINKYKKSFGWEAQDDLVDRIGLNEKQVAENNLLTVELEKKGRKDRTLDPRIQEWIDTFGDRKCESNVFVTNPELGRRYLLQAVVKYWGTEFKDYFAHKDSQVRKQVVTFEGQLGLKKDFGKLETSISGLIGRLDRLSNKEEKAIEKKNLPKTRLRKDGKGQGRIVQPSTASNIVNAQETRFALREEIISESKLLKSRGLSPRVINVITTRVSIASIEELHKMVEQLSTFKALSDDDLADLVSSGFFADRQTRSDSSGLFFR